MRQNNSVVEVRIQYSFQVEPLSSGLGARISGIDFHPSFDDTVMGAIRQAWLNYFVVVISGQTLSSEEQLKFTEWFGARQTVRTVRQTKDAPQNYMYVANKSVEGLEGVLPEGEMQFHTDQCYYETPSRATVLYAIEVPQTGGNTKFANAYRAYESLGGSTKARIRGLYASNVYDYQANATEKKNQSSPDAPRYEHPVVIRHPETGREVLYVNRLMTDFLVGLDGDESDELLEELFCAIEDPSHIYEHAWSPGDLVMWDNLCTQHARTWFDPKMTRVLRRTSLAGSAPLAA